MAELTGAKHDQEKPRTDLLPTAPLLEIAKVLGFGAKKYTQYGECNCHVTMIKNTIENIEQKIAKGSTSTNVYMLLRTLLTEIEKRDKTLNENTTSATKKLKNFLDKKSVQFVGQTISSASITTTPSIKSENVFANLVTSLLVSLKEENGTKKHSSTCESTKVYRSGEGNWRGGIAYSRLIGAAMRHLLAFNDGEDKDPESGLSHLAHLGCCVVFLLEQEAKGTGLDDRYRPSS